MRVEHPTDNRAVPHEGVGPQSAPVLFRNELRKDLADFRKLRMRARVATEERDHPGPSSHRFDRTSKHVEAHVHRITPKRKQARAIAAIEKAARAGDLYLHDIIAAVQAFIGWR